MWDCYARATTTACGCEGERGCLDDGVGLAWPGARCLQQDAIPAIEQLQYMHECTYLLGVPGPPQHAATNFEIFLRCY